MDKEAMYLAAGTIVVANIGTIITVIIAALKLAAKFGKMEHQIDINTKDINAAHQRIRNVEFPTSN